MAITGIGLASGIGFVRIKGQKKIAVNILSGNSSRAPPFHENTFSLAKKSEVLMKVLAYWFLIFVALVFAIPAMHIPFSAAYSPAAAILVGTPLFGLLLCRIGFSGLASWVGRMVRLELTENDQILVEQLNSGALLLAGMGVIFGMIHVLRNLANPDAIGPGIALVFVTLVYGALVPVLLLPFHNRRTVNRLMKEAAVFAFLVSPLSVGVALSAFHIAKVF